MGTPVSSGNRGVLALGASLVGLLVGSDGNARQIVMLLSHSRREIREFSAVCGSVLAEVLPCRLSMRSHVADHLSVICAMALLYRVVPFVWVRTRIAGAVPWIREVRSAAWVGDIRGGDSFSDIYGMGRFLLGFAMAWSVVMIRGDIVQLPQTYGPYRSPIARVLARWLLRRSSVIIARDRESQRIAQELVGSEPAVRLSPDVAFSLEAVRPAVLFLDPPLVNQDPVSLEDSATRNGSGAGRHTSPMCGPIGVNVNGLMYHGGYTRGNMFGLRLDYVRFLSSVLHALAAEHSGEVWLVPHTFATHGSVESDPEACQKVRGALAKSLTSRVRIVSREYDEHEIKGIIGLCDFFVGSRMHACIAALSQGVPCVGVAYSMKFAGVFETVGMEDWVVDGRTTGEEEAARRVLSLYKQRGSVRESLRRRAEAARLDLREIFDGLRACGAGYRRSGPVTA
jgi:colanic acid/amylovoran biosynthesis protein